MATHQKLDEADDHEETPLMPTAKIYYERCTARIRECFTAQIRECCTTRIWEYCTTTMILHSLVYIFTYWPWETVTNIRISTGHHQEGDDAIGHQDGENNGSPAVQNDQLGDDCESGRISPCKLIGTPLLISFIIMGVLFQSITCFSRQNPYAHWVQDYDFSKSNNDNLTDHCKLKCDTDKNFITGLLFPDVIIILLSLWIHLAWQIDYLICKCQNTRRLNYWRQQVRDYLDITSLNTLINKSELRRSTIIMFTLFSVFYIILSFLISVFYLYAFGFLKDAVKQSEIYSSNNNLQFPAILFSLLGFVAFDLLCIQVTLRYAYRCKLLIEYLKSVETRCQNYTSQTTNETRQTRIEQHQTVQNATVHADSSQDVGNQQPGMGQDQTLSEQITAIQGDSPQDVGSLIFDISTGEFTIQHQESITNANKFLRELNNSTFTTGIIIVIAGYTAFSCMVNLFYTKRCPQFSQDLQILAITLRLLLWLCIALFPFYKAGEVNEASRKLCITLIECSRDPKMVSKRVKHIISEARLIGILVQPWLPYTFLLIIIFAIMLGSGIKYFHWL